MAKGPARQSPEFLTVRICTLVQNAGPLTDKQIAEQLDIEFKRAQKIVQYQRSSGCLEHVSTADGMANRFIKMPVPRSQPKRIPVAAPKQTYQGIPAAPRLPPDLSRTLKRNIFENWDLCLRSPRND